MIAAMCGFDALTKAIHIMSLYLCARVDGFLWTGFYCGLSAESLRSENVFFWSPHVYSDGASSVLAAEMLSAAHAFNFEHGLRI